MDVLGATLLDEWFIQVEDDRTSFNWADTQQ